MANTRRDPVGYRPFRTQALLSEGLLPVSRDNGDLERRIAQGMFHAAGYFGEKADAQAAREGFAAGQKAALEGRTISTIKHDDPTPVVTSDGKPVKPKPAGSMAAYARDRYAKVHGLPAHVAAALAGHGQAESAFNPNAIGDNGTAIGFYQWRGNRASELKAFAKARGKHWKDTDTQLDFVVHELKSSERLAWGALNRSRNVEEATAAFMHFERPQGWTINNPRAGHNFSGRLAFAQGLLGAQAPSVGTPDDIPDVVQTGAVASATPEPTGTAITLSGGTSRPSGRDTVYGRAYDKGQIGTYVSMLETEVERTTAAVFRKYRDSPEQLATAYDDLRKEFLREHVFPEIGADFEQAFTRKTGAFIDASYDEMDRKAKETNIAQFNQATVDLETEQQQVLAGVDMASPAAPDIVLGQQAAIDKHYDDAVSKGLMGADDAQKAKAVSKRKASYDFYTRQADTLDADGVKTMREAMQADFADGGIDGVDGDGWVAIEENLKSVERKKRSEVEQNRGDLRRRGDTMAKRIALGFDVNKEDMATYMQEAATLPGGKEELAETQAKIDIGRAVRDLPLGEAQQKLDAMRKDAGENATDGQINALMFGQDMLTDRMKTLADAPLTYAEEVTGATLTPIDTSNPEALAQSLEVRRTEVEKASRKAGIALPLFKPEEVKAIKSGASASDPARHTASMAQLAFIAQESSLKDVSETFGDEAVTALQDWDAHGRYLTQGEMQQWLKERHDPNWKERVKPLVSEGEKAARKIGFDDVVTLLDPNLYYDALGPVDDGTRRMMMDDFAMLAGERFAVTGDHALAQEQAVERMKKRWGVTSLAYGDRSTIFGTETRGQPGGRLMPYPPESHYPAIGGGRDWMDVQFKAVAGALGASAADIVLVPDGQTRNEAEAGRSPGYLLSRIDPETGLNELVVDTNGSVQRFYFDPVKAQKSALDAAQSERADRNTPWFVLDQKTSVGPFYPPWRPATKADMELRKQKINDILQERRSTPGALIGAMAGKKKP
ncbi:MAG: phage tail tip lysozyme [Rhizobiaceae bacterium]